MTAVSVSIGQYHFGVSRAPEQACTEVRGWFNELASGRVHFSRPVTAAGAPDRDREVAASLGLVRGQDADEHLLELVEERRGDRPLKHVVADLRVVPRERPQVLDPVRVGQEPHVHHDVGVEREAVLVAEALDRDLQHG